MNLTFLIPGKARESFLTLGYQEYLKRIQGFGKARLVFLPEERIPTPSKSLVERALEKEAERALSMIKEKDLLVLLDIHAALIDSAGLARKLGDLSSRRANVFFYVGSSYGLSDTLRKRADFSFSLSKLTFTHYLAMLLLLEQVYRSLKILSGEEYDK